MKYHIAREDEKIGEFTDLEVSAGLRQEQFRPTDLCWTAGMGEWEPLSKRFPPAEPADAVEAAASPAAHEEDGPRTRPGDIELASRFLRLAAWMIDWITMIPASMLFSRALEMEAFLTKNAQLPPEALMDAYFAHIDAMVKAHPERFHLPMGMLLVLLVINLALLVMSGQTIGKWVTGVRIVRFQTGLRASFVSVVLLRHVVMFILLGIPYLTLGLLVFDLGCIFRRDRRCLHDMIADTMVISTRRKILGG
ncbi:MAG: RDD family protein [Verrucomicrobiaceae bacterium]|nr:RDD family protein [Verrucomicrobiaceae bacterium]